MSHKEEHSGGHKKHKGSNPLFMVFRVILSLAILCALFLLCYSAFKSFSGLDPLKINPHQVASNLLDSHYLYNIAAQILSFDPSQGTDLGKIASQFTSGIVPEATEVPKGQILYRFAVVADSHNDNQYLADALNQAKAGGAAFVIGLGDYTDVGTDAELVAAKAQFDQAGLPYYSTAGDHDLWDSRDKKDPAITNYAQAFGSPYSSFGYKNSRFLILYNADNYLGMDDVQRTWAMEELQAQQDSQPLFVFAAIPFYHPSSDHVMGKTTPSLREQAEAMMDDFEKYNVSHVFAGDAHIYSSYTEPISQVKMTTVGAITSSRNSQNPRFVMVDVYDSGQYTINDTEIRR